MRVTEFIAEQLDYELIKHPIESVKTTCRMCGKKVERAVHQKHAIGSNFTDYAWLRYESNYLCLDCVACMGFYREYYRISESNLEKLAGKISENDLAKLKEIVGQEFPNQDTFRMFYRELDNEEIILKKAVTLVPLRSFSFVCTETDLNILSHDDLMETLLYPPQPPFVICIGESGKKHLAFKAKINNSRERYHVATDGGLVAVDLLELTKIHRLIQPWYTVIPEKEMTYFSKAEILSGCDNLKRMEDYGVEKYIRESTVISNYRGSSLFRLAVHCLKKAGG